MQNDTLPTLEPDNLIAGRYRRKQFLGRGSFGEVFYAEDIKFERDNTLRLWDVA